MSAFRTTVGAMSLTVGLALVPGLPASAAPQAATGAAALTAAVASPSTYSGYSSGTGVYTSAVNVMPAVANVGLAHAAAAVATGTSTLQAADSLTQPLYATTPTGKTALGHAAALTLGALASPADQPTLQETLAEATSPSATQATSSGELTAVPIAPVATADLLPGAAGASSAADGSCMTDGPLSTGAAHAANAQVLMVPADPIVMIGGSVDSVSQTSLVKQAAAADGTPTAGLTTSTIETVAPITLLAGTPAALTITVLAPLQLSTTTTGLPGGATVSYAPVGIDPVDPLVSITAGGMTQTLTSQQVLGNGGLVIGLGVADLTIGAPAHALGGNETTTPTAAADGTTAGAEADLVRLTVPGTLPVTASTDGPLAPVLNPVLGPLATALSPVTTALGTALATAGLGVADVRIGHLESTATVPAGGILCPAAAPAAPAVVSPFTENYKDVSALTAAPGQTFDYTVRFPNRGTSDATDVVVTDTYAPGLTLVSSTPAAASTGTNSATFDVGTVAAGAFAQVHLTFRVPADAAAGTVYTNTAVITSTYAGSPTSDTVTVSGPTVAAPTGVGCILTYSTMYASNTAVVTGENFTDYTNVLDSGTGPCTGVVATEPLPTGTSFVSCTGGCTFDGTTITWPIGTLQPGQSTTVSVTLKTTATSGTVPGTATITATNGDPVTVSTPDPAVSGTSVGRPGDPAGCTTGCPAAELAFTGVADWLAPIAGLLILGGALVRRRRLATA